jgi:Fe2+ or Zn2+ uptake regulation protein
MKSDSLVINSLKQQGFKITKARIRTLEMFQNSHAISVPELIKQLKKESLVVNKSTIYREVAFLLKQSLIRQVDFRERGIKYEFVSNKHHHHLICVVCKSVQDFELEQDLDIQEEKIEKSKSFQVLNHSLEFFGLCSQCQKNTL